METEIFKKLRNSYLEYNKVYFWTSTVKDWKKLFNEDKYKLIIINALKELADKKMIAVYGFVIMPNHIHLIWELLKPNGKERPSSSFNKKTAHLILIDLKTNHQKVLPYFKVNETERRHRIWQRDALAIKMFSLNVLIQKLDYLHNNPLQAHWNLAKTPEEYKWSSASFYETENDTFGFLTHFKDRFG